MKYTLIEKILAQVIGFAQGVILARLLSPEDFGLAAMLGVFLAVGGALAESGLGAAYVVYGGNTRRIRRWNVGVAIVMYACLAALAPLIARFFAQPILCELMWVMGFGLILNAACVVGMARLQREKYFGVLSTINTLVTLIAFVVGCTLAYLEFGVWAIAGVGIAGGLARLMMLMIYFRCASHKAAAAAPACELPKLLSYGAKLTLSGLVHTVYLNLYQLIIGKLVNPTAAGLFFRAQRWASLPVEVVNDSVGRIALPNLVSGEVAGRKYILFNAALLLPCAAVLWLFAEDIVGFVLGAAWLDSVPYLRILLVGVLFTPITNVSLSYLRAKGRADLVLATDATKKPLQIAALVCGAMCGSVAALCWAKVVSDFFEAAVDFGYAWRLRWKTEWMWLNTVKLADYPWGAELKALHEACALDRMLEGKTIAVVGNGPSEIGKGLGEEIDAHEIVIRFNNFVTKGYERDYGTRCEVWMKGGAADVVHKPRSGVKAVLYTDDIVDDSILLANANAPKRELDAGLIVDYIGAADARALTEAMGCRPSSGALLLTRLRRIKGVKVDVYGFSFLEATRNPDGVFTHYAHDVTPEHMKNLMLSAHHDLDAETAYLAALFSDRHLAETSAE